MTTKSKAQQEKHKMSEIDENISKLFDVKKRLGKGAYGIVWKALDKRTNETVAVKKIFDAFRDETDAQRTFREIVFLKAFRNHPNVIRLLTVYRASNNLDIYLIFEYMESDLHNIIKKGTILKDIHKRYVMYQLINAIKYIHSGNVIHRDLKPSNVLIDSKCRCKLADFGLARSVSNRPIRDNNDVSRDPIIEPLLTDYVATRWYRAPEILIASKRYTKGIDMWSLGCILGEMIRGKPLFQGSSTVNQIEKIVTALPEISDHDIHAVGAGFGSVLLNKQISHERRTSLSEMMADAPEDAVNMVESLLVLDPLARLTAKQALGHPYVEKFRNSIPEIELNVDILPPFRDDVRLTVPEYRSKLYEIVQLNNEKADKRQTSSNAKSSSIKQKDHKQSNAYDKFEATKKSHKIKQNSSTEDKYISKDKYFSRPEKHESETQPSVSVPSINGKPIKKMVPVSPNAKRKFVKAQSKYFTEHSTEMVKSKNHSKSHESYEDNLPINTLDKRHSIDGGYASLPDGGAANFGAPAAEIVGRQITSPNGALRKIESTRRQYRSSSSICRGEQTNSQEQSKNHLAHTHAHPHSQQQLKHSQQHNSFVYPDTECERTYIEEQDRHNHNTNTFLNKPSCVRGTKSGVINCVVGGSASQSEHMVRNNERLCYEKRLKKLEEEIEKYKKEVKSFCKETFSYTYPQSPYKNGKSHNQSQNQNYNRNTSYQQMQQSRSQAQQQQHVGRTKCDGSNSRNQQQQYNQYQQPQSSLPNMLAAHQPNTQKQNPYYNLLAKVSRDFGGKNGIHSVVASSTAATGGSAVDEGGEYFADRPANVVNKDILKDQKHQQTHGNSNLSQPHQQPVNNHQRHARPISKFIARPQLSDHFTKQAITNYQ
ncbi:extracellular signal-regulated kinase 7 isoform X1 [Anastrepha obliqua]|uniref:extracellular signal-regulated kinase 7 isoform X1 n=1 Tax=Anastrepha obliqua TaxID=95512 RepID=UPI00240A8783|nr:extracellular signal-regulated kinase 7 isoform X1 [Anastrepha obliqua]XP_054727115.1 extracellular signal-regulated kinase 7 isoform X1 [Anastrepha obliqua]